VRLLILTIVGMTLAGTALAAEPLTESEKERTRGKSDPRLCRKV
jgi:hypothetical protein